MATAAVRVEPLDAALEVVTPENIAFTYPVAGPFRRLPAFLVDLLIRGALVTIGWLIFLLPAFAGLVPIGVSTGLGLAAWFAVGYFYGGMFETFWNGQTPGKRAFGLRVVGVDGAPITALQAVLRNILRDVDALPFVFAAMAEAYGPTSGWGALQSVGMYWVGLIAMSATNRFQRLGDLACGTIVVVDAKATKHDIVRFNEPAVVELAGRLPGDLIIGRQLAQSLAMYVERRRNFAPARRREIAQHVGRPMVARCGLPATTDDDLLLCALYWRTYGSETKPVRW